MSEERGLRVLAVDDEVPALGELTYLLGQADGVGEVVSAGNAADALAALQQKDFDAIFMDIRMPGIDGLALARVVNRFAVPPQIVFVTAYDDHAVDAFDIAAADYLLKPLRPERLASAIERVARRIAADPVAKATDPQEPLDVDETIAVELGGVTRYVKRSDITFVEAQGDYVRLHTRQAGHLVRTPLSALEGRWSDAGFLRVHRQYLVNAAFVEELRSAGGRLSLALGGGQSVPVSRRYTAAVKQALVRRHRLDREDS